MRYLYAKKSQRFVIYLIDFLLISVAAEYIANGIEYLAGFDKSGMNIYFDSMRIELLAIMSGKTTSTDTLSFYLSKYYQYFMVDLAFKLIIDFILVVILLVVVPKFCGGKTLGRRAMGCKLVDKTGHDASIKKLIIREVLGTFVGYCFLGAFFGVVGLISLILVLATSRSLPDILSGTYMVIDDPIKAEKPSESLKENEVKPDYTEVEKEELNEDSQDKYSVDEDDYKIE